MHTILSNYGHRYATQIMNESCCDYKMLLDILQQKRVPYQKQHDLLIEKGYLQTTDASKDEIALRYERNPLENVSRIVIEYTTYCNLNCLHCRSGIVKRVTETNTTALKEAADLFINMGIKRFDFIGGEVSKYGDGWLELTKHIQKQGDFIITVYTNGWWLEKENFTAAGRKYANVENYLTDLMAHGLTHIIFSLDGPERIHDQWRQQKGLFRRILNGFDTVKKAGLNPRVSLVAHANLNEEQKLEYGIFMDELAKRIYSEKDIHPLQKVMHLVQDPTNHISNFIDINNAVQLREGHFHLSQIPDDILRCKAMYRPSPTLRIMASGEVAICPLLNSAEKYGNIHQHKLIDIINSLQERFIFKLHAEKRLGEYIKFIDTNIFGDKFDHVCSLRTVINLIARRMHERNVSPENKEAIAQINREVAILTGHAKEKKLEYAANKVGKANIGPLFEGKKEYVIF